MEAIAEMITEEAASQIEEARVFLETNVASVTIENETQYAGAAGLIKEMKTRKKTLEETRAAEKEPHLTAGRAVDAAFKPITNLLDEKIALIEKAGRVFREKQEAIRQAEQKRLQDEAEKERLKLESQANTSAEKAAALRQAAQDYRSQAAEANDVDEANRLLSDAAICERRALKYDEKVEANVQQAASVVAPVVQRAVPKTTMGSFNTRAYYEARVTNMDAFIGYVKDQKQHHLVSINQSALNQMATIAKGGACPIPGVEYLRK